MLEPAQKIPRSRGSILRSDSGTNSIPRCSTANFVLSPSPMIMPAPLRSDSAPKPAQVLRERRRSDHPGQQSVPSDARALGAERRWHSSAARSAANFSPTGRRRTRKKDRADAHERVLGNLRATEARPEVEPFPKHNHAWIRREATNALTRIDRPSIPKRTSLKELSAIAM